MEYWAHEASLIPIELHPLFRWRMADVDREAWGSISRVIRERPELVAETLELVTEQGPIRARDTGAVRPPPVDGRMWNWHEGKVALEHLFFTGQVGAARRVNFERLYDTIDRVLPAEILERPTLMRPKRSASSCGSRRGLSASRPSPTSATTSGFPAPTPRRGWPSSSRPASCSR